MYMTQKKYKVNKEIVHQVIDGELVIFDSDNSLLLTLNETATAIFNSLSKEQTIDDIVRLMTSEFDVETKQAKKDTRTLIDELIKKNIVTAI